MQHDEHPAGLRQSHKRSGATLWTVVALTVFYVSEAAHAQDYRTIDGYGNNIANPTWGTPSAHLLRSASGAYYADGIASPAGATRPSPREISNAVFTQNDALIPARGGQSDFMWTWGQFLDHDLGLTEGTAENFPIDIPAGDAFFDPQGTGTKTMPFRRAIFDAATGRSTSNPREQINEVTGYIDGSMVYGSDGARAAWLRSGPYLKVSSGNLLPHNDGTQPNAGTPEKPNLSPELFVAGDIRANEQPTLAAMHTLFVREHNYQVDRIRKAKPSLDDEELYQRARQIVIAEIQHVTYEEYLPALLGRGGLHTTRRYDAGANPGLSSLFSTAAFRLGHTMLSSKVLRLKENGKSIEEGPFSLRDAFFEAAPPMLARHGIEPLIRGVAAQRMQELDNKIIDDVRNFLFGAPGAGGLDLIALNIQRGRDMGLPDFNTVRSDFGLPRKSSFSEITSDRALATTLEQLYGNVDEIDLFVGLLCEDDIRGTMLGETLRTILVDQFHRSRAGDRYWYTRTLKGKDLAMVHRTRLSDIIRRNTSIRNIQEDVFFVTKRDR
ncbi:peroxidase family protein [Methylocaldum sp.]|uniref:peroxidase family protein n=1 Tax=Methylocaldum sp. TaxID=1969727 RepID=UPI002D5CC79A|nr:peroxidase family protein [Methylocaldum sp.]HYE34825.1 peroxidase family protein [Methylocaldum sp.]